MKETTPHDATTATATPAAGKPRLVVGLDVDLNFCVTAIQTGHGPVRPAQKWTRAQLVKWVREQVAAGHDVHTVYEACGFGYTLHEELTAAGAHNVVTTPTRLSPERRRKNDRLDARELCVVHEAGPYGFGLCRHLRAPGIACAVVAPSLIPKKASDKVKTDRRDADPLARLFRAGELTPLHVADQGVDRRDGVTLVRSRRHVCRGCCPQGARIARHRASRSVGEGHRGLASADALGLDRG